MSLPDPRPWASELVVLSARSREQLSARLTELIGLSPLEASHRASAAEGEEHRLAIIATDAEDLEARIARALRLLQRSSKARGNVANRILYGDIGSRERSGRVGWLFPGFGAQETAAGGELWASLVSARRLSTHPDLVVRERIRHHLELLGQEVRADLATGEGLIHTMDAVVANSMALMAVLQSLGVPCDDVVGHSFGAANALVAGRSLLRSAAVFELLDHVREAALRQSWQPDTALAVGRISVELREALLADHVEVHVALDNCPQQAVLCGPREPMSRVREQVEESGGFCFPIPLLAASVHTPRFPLPPDALTDVFGRLDFGPPERSIWCCGAAQRFPRDIDSLREQLVLDWHRTTRFRETVEAMHEAGVRTFLEVGAGSYLTGFVRDTLRGREFVALATHQPGQAAERAIQLLLARLYLDGHSIDIARLETERPCEPAEAAVDSAPPPASMFDLGQDGPTSLAPLVKRVLHHVAELLDFEDAEDLDSERGFFELGLGSLAMVDLAARLEGELGLVLSPVCAFDHSTASALAAFLAASVDRPAGRGRRQDAGEPIAIIGAGCRFPGDVSAPADYWRLLCEGGDATSDVPPDRFPIDEYHDPTGEHPGTIRTRRGAFLKDLRGFDPRFFRMSPYEASTLDPQQRLLLEVVWETLEDAAIDPGRLAGAAIGVYVGISGGDYGARLSPAERISVGGYIGTGTLTSMAAGRLAYLMGWKGPALAVDTACSSSLVATHLAVRSLRNGECDLAVAAGVNVLLSPELSIMLSAAGALAQDGRCKAFDAAADGYVRGEGCGAVLLKPLARALDDGDRILAVIRGSAINHDGRTSGLTVPNGSSQEALIRAALADGGLDAADIDYVEAHGTGTALGDPIEVAALGRVFGPGRTRRLKIGSVKTNIGHLEAAAGLAGLLKTALQLHHGLQTPSLHFHEPSPHVPWADLPIDVVTAVEETTSADIRGRASVSSFGMSGTNAHVVLEAPPLHEAPPDTGCWSPAVLTLSAASTGSLARLVRRHVDSLTSGAGEPWRDYCYTSNVGRTSMEHRIAIPSSAPGEAVEAMMGLVTLAEAGGAPWRRVKGPARVAWMFAGQGSQRAEMGRELYDRVTVFREQIDRFEELLRPYREQPLREVLFGDATDLLDETAWTQPALFAFELALARTWSGWGIDPAVVTGHSLGEYVAACVAGVFSIEDGIALVAERARLMSTLPSAGAMLACAADEAQIQFLVSSMTEGLSIAAINAPDRVVLSGPADAVERAAGTLASRGISSVKLPVSHAFHSALMEPVCSSFERVLRDIELRSPRIPVISNLTGRIETDRLAQPSYWLRQLRETVRFEDCVTTACAHADLLVEVGPAATLTSLARKAAEEAGTTCCSSLAPGIEPLAGLTLALSTAFEAGALIDWSAVHEGAGLRRTRLPTYPFEREPCWVEPPAEVAGAPFLTAASERGSMLLGRELALPGMENEVRFESAVSLLAPGFLRDYSAMGRPTLPHGACLHVLARAVGEGAVALESIKFHSPPLVLQSHTSRLHTVRRDGVDERPGCHLFGCDEESGWRMLAEAEPCAAQAMPTASDPGPVEGESLDGASFYQATRALGIRYGPSFATIQTIDLGPRAVSARVVVPVADVTSTAEGPETVLLESCLQVAGALAAAAAGSGGVHRLERIDRLTLALPPDLALPIELTIRASTQANGADGYSARLVARSDIDGRTVCAMDGLRYILEASKPDPEPSELAAPDLDLRQLAAAGGDARPLRDHLSAILRRLLGYGSGVRLDTADALTSLGMDSITAVHFRHHVRSQLQVDLPLELFVIDGSIDSLTAEVLARADSQGGPAMPNQVSTLEHRRSEICELSAGQQALWFLWRLSPKSSAYNQSLPIRVRPAPSARRWRTACRALVARHPMLRTVFEVRDEVPIQRVLPVDEGDPCFLAIDARCWSERELDSALADAHAPPFDLEAAPAVRFRLFVRPGDEAVLLVTLHHVVCDATSLGILREELPALLDDSGGATLAPIAHTYHDFTRWQRDYLDGEEGRHLEASWRERLAGEPPVLNLPWDRPRPAVQRYVGAEVRLALPASTERSVRSIAHHESLPASAVYLTAFLLLLQRYTGLDDLILGMPTTGRTRPELAPIFGYFVDPVVLRVHLPAGSSGRRAMHRVRAASMAALADRDFPFARLVERLAPTRDPSRSPFFDVTFNHLRVGARGRSAATPSVVVHSDVVALEQADGKFDLTMSVLELAEETEVSLGYSVALFDQETIERIGSEYVRLLTGLAAAPDEPADQLPIFEPAQVAVRRGPRHPRSWADRSIHERVRAHAMQQPDQVALQCGPTRITYAELWRQVDRIASRLIERGVGADAPVGLHMRRGVDAVSGMLGIMAAGGAYMPLDEAHSPDRLEPLLNQAAARWVVTDGSPALENAVALPFAALVADGAPSHPLPEVAGASLAYVIFTSGSSGAAKAIAIEHRTLCNYVDAAVERFAFAVGAYGNVSSFAADLGHTTLFGGLAVGGTVHILSDEAVRRPRAYREYLSSYPLDYLKVVPSHLAALTEPSLDAAVLPRRVLILGGESTSTVWARDLLRAAPACQLFNHYGPAEATVGVITWEATPEAMQSIGPTLPLEDALDGCDLRILDPEGRTLPRGVVGELYLGGRCLARGYQGRPRETASSFGCVSGSPSAASAERWYRTGDRARMDARGRLEIVGRVDRQLKISGFRVEPGQVEAAIEAYPGVRQCVVVAGSVLGRGEPELCAFFVADPEATSADPKALRRHLAERLPRYMVPARIEPITSLPVTANGKIDFAALQRRLLALSETVSGSASFGGGFDSASSDRELELSKVWRELLGHDRFSLDDSFFEVGGHSLLAVRLAGRIETDFGVTLPLATLFTNPTVSALARTLDSDTDLLPGVLVPLGTPATGVPLFCFPGAGGSVLYLNDLTRRLDYKGTIYGAQALGLDPQTPIPADIESAAAGYLEAIRSVQEVGPYHLLGHSYGGVVVFELARLLAQNGERLGFVGILDNAAPRPEDRRRFEGWGPRRWLEHVALRIGKLARVELELADCLSDQYGYDEQVARLTRQLRERGVLPGGAESGDFARFLEIYQANARATVEYEPRALPEPVLLDLFTAEDRDSELLGVSRVEDEDLGWSRYVARPVRVHVSPGTHLTMLMPPHVPTLARLLSRTLES